MSPVFPGHDLFFIPTIQADFEIFGSVRVLLFAIFFKDFAYLMVLKRKKYFCYCLKEIYSCNIIIYSLERLPLNFIGRKVDKLLAEER
jgi:hypothetical protein